MPVMDTAVSPLPDDVEALRALLSAALERADDAEDDEVQGVVLDVRVELRPQEQ